MVLSNATLQGQQDKRGYARGGAVFDPMGGLNAMMSNFGKLASGQATPLVKPQKIAGGWS